MGLVALGRSVLADRSRSLHGIRNIHFVPIYILSETSYKHEAVRVISTVHTAGWGHLSFIYIFPSGKRDECLYPAAAAWAVFPLPEWSCPWQHSAFPVLVHPVPSHCSPLIAAPILQYEPLGTPPSFSLCLRLSCHRGFCKLQQLCLHSLKLALRRWQ